jgi:maltokinase
LTYVVVNRNVASAVLLAGSLTELLMAWLPGQRWFAGGIRISDVDVMSDTQLAPGDPEYRHLLIRAWTGGTATIYQVAVGLRAGPPPVPDSAVIGQAADGRIAYDALHDPELTRLLLLGMADGRRTGPIRFAAQVGAVIPDSPRARLLSADSSNTSIVFGDQAILKILRRPHAGRHPDLEIPAALTRRGSKIVPALLGWIEHTGDDEPTLLAILSQYLPGATSGWDLATANVVAGQAAFTRQARALGEISSVMHAQLADEFGIVPLSAADLADLVAVMNADLDAAMIAVPGLRQYELNLRSCYAELSRLDKALPAQRIHGDYHLGQVLEASGRWVVIDFEGEPAVPLARRLAFAPALRDVAGMLRSFDYASRQPFMDGSVLEDPDGLTRVRAHSWAADCQEAFCDGYSEASGTDLREAAHILKAFLMQKAVYEAAYEARHRPSWINVPMSAIAEACG